MLKDPGRKAIEGKDLSIPLFLTDNLLVELQRQPRIAMTQDFLGRLDVDAELPKGSCQSVSKWVPSSFSAGRMWRLRIMSGAMGCMPFLATEGNR